MNKALTGVELEELRLEAERNNVHMTAETLGIDLLGMIVDEFKALPNVWQKMPQYDQDEVIERVRQRVQAAAKHAIGMIYSGGHSKILAYNEGVAIKDDIKATLNVMKTNDPEALQELYASHKKAVLIVLVDDERFTGGMDEVKGDPDQGGMFDEVKAGDADDENEGDPLYQEAVDLVVEKQKANISFIQRTMKLGYNRAARFIERMEEEGIVSKQNSSGQREVLRTA